MTLSQPLDEMNVLQFCVLKHKWWWTIKQPTSGVTSRSSSWLMMTSTWVLLIKIKQSPHCRYKAFGWWFILRSLPIQKSFFGWYISPHMLSKKWLTTLPTVTATGPENIPAAALKTCSRTGHTSNQAVQRTYKTGTRRLTNPISLHVVQTVYSRSSAI